jgi:hypothetical protein
MTNLSRTVRKLLQTIADRDTGDGVMFVSAPRGRWQMDGTNYTVNDRTFHPLVDLGFLEIGNGRTDPVRVTGAGRAYLAGGTR